MPGKIFFLVLVSLLLISCNEKEDSETILKFKDGKFRIAQFTDIHFKYNSYRSDSALVIMQKVISGENPDLIVLTGDIVTSENTRQAWLSLTKVLVDAKVPWAVMFGNHDPEYELSKEQILETISGLPFNVTEEGPSEIAGKGNYVLEVKASDSDKTAALLYCIDSQASFNPETGLGTYQWIDLSQIAWYRDQSRIFTCNNGNKPLPALAFFHIPLPEYKEVIGEENTVGVQEETVCSPDLNSGMYTAMIECRDVMGVFVGHDHDNDYIGCLRNICLAYGNVTGRQCYGEIGRGARIIDLYEDERRFDTFILKLYECDRDKDTWYPVEDQTPRYFVTFRDSVLSRGPE